MCAYDDHKSTDVVLTKTSLNELSCYVQLLSEAHSHSYASCVPMIATLVLTTSLGVPSSFLLFFLLSSPYLSLGSPEGTRLIEGVPTLLGLNCNSSRLAVVDSNGILNILDLHDHSSDPQEVRESLLLGLL